MPPLVEKKSIVDKANAALETPLLQLLGKGAWIMVVLIVGLMLYAGRARLQEEIENSPTAETLRRSDVTVGALATSNQTSIREVAESLKQAERDNVALLTKVDGITKSQQSVLIQLAVTELSVQETNRNLDKLEQSVKELSQSINRK